MEHQKEVQSTLRMSRAAFEHLVDLLREDITFDEIRAKNSSPDSEPIYPELVVAVCIRRLAGGTFTDIKNWAGISKTSFYRCRDTFFRALFECDDLSIKWPDNREELERLARGFEHKSRYGLFKDCVGAVDGFLATITQPHMSEELNNPRAYYSGHYCCFGLNVQAMCDANLKFNYLAVSSPGGTPDVTAYRECSLHDQIEALPNGFHVVGDPAYILTEKLLIPYSGPERVETNNNVFNFFLSQLRIRIEMAFGLLTTKWRIFRRPLEGNMATMKNTILAAFILHNYVLDYDKIDVEKDSSEDLTSMNSVEGLESNGIGYIEVPNPSELVSIQGHSQLRQRLRQQIIDNGYERPRQNIDRAEREQAQYNYDNHI